MKSVVQDEEQYTKKGRHDFEIMTTFFIWLIFYPSFFLILATFNDMELFYEKNAT